jgi:hypothetical protein
MSAIQRTIQPQPAPGFVSSLLHRLVRQIKVQVADWQDTCRELAAWEDRYLVELPAPERLAEHVAMLDELERVGGWLTAAASQPGLGDTQTAEQIQLTIQDLRDSRAMWHRNVPAARRQEILDDCFNES